MLNKAKKLKLRPKGRGQKVEVETQNFGLKTETKPSRSMHWIIMFTTVRPNLFYYYLQTLCFTFISANNYSYDTCPEKALEQRWLKRYHKFV